MANSFYTRNDSFPPVIKNLIIINAIVYLAQVLLDSHHNITNRIGLYSIDSPSFKPYQIVTHMFAHSTEIFIHIVFNMFALWMLGRILENVWGAKRFLFFYLICGIGAAACHLLVLHFRGGGSVFPTVGASGAIMGITVAFAMLFPNTELYIMFIPMPVKAKWAVLGYVLVDLFGGIANYRGDNIAHFTHLGGAITGFIVILIWNKFNKRTFY